MPNTNIYSIPYPASSDIPELHTDLQDIANAVEPNVRTTEKIVTKGGTLAFRAGADYSAAQNPGIISWSTTGTGSRDADGIVTLTLSAAPTDIVAGDSIFVTSLNTEYDIAGFEGTWRVTFISGTTIKYRSSVKSAYSGTTQTSGTIYKVAGENNLPVGANNTALEINKVKRNSLEWSDYAESWVPISFTTLTTNATTISLSSIPQTYRDLRLVTCLRQQTTGTGLSTATFTFFANNGGTSATNIFYHRIVTNNVSPITSSTASSGTLTSIEVTAGVSQLAAARAVSVLDIMNYRTDTERITRAAGYTVTGVSDRASYKPRVKIMSGYGGTGSTTSSGIMSIGTASFSAWNSADFISRIDISFPAIHNSSTVALYGRK